MRKKLLGLTVLLSLVTLSSCKYLSGISNSVYKVTFDNGIEALENKVVDTDMYQRVNLPSNPKKTGYIFLNWVDKDGKIYDFSKIVNSDMTLYANYALDYQYFGNMLSTDTIKETVKVVNETYNKALFGGQTDVSTSTGSGVIFKSNDNSYYALTNNHVVYTEKQYRKVVIYDYLDNSYECAVEASDPEYDLAVLRFTTLNDMQIAQFDETVVKACDDVAAIGNPKNQRNAITYGNVIGYGRLDTSALDTRMSNVKFDCIKSTCFINNGSSGGGLFNEYGKLVGITFAASEAKDTGEFIAAYTIPVDKIYEFLTKYNLM